VRAASLAALLLGALAVGLPPQAAAAVGVGVGASPIVLKSVAKPGHAYALPALFVVNTGTVGSTYHLSLQRLSPGTGRNVPPGWVHFAANDFRLRPKESASVAVTIAVPSDAASGEYLSDLVAGTVAQPSPHRSALAGSRAATKLMFRVGRRGWTWPWHWSWKMGAVAGAILIIGAAALAQRRLGLRLRVERRT
jgi:hypothetical protein